MGELPLSVLSYSHFNAGSLCFAYGVITIQMGPWAVLLLWSGMTLIASPYQAKRENAIRAKYPGHIVEERRLPSGFLVIDEQTRRVLGRTDRRGCLSV